MFYSRGNCSLTIVAFAMNIWDLKLAVIHNVKFMKRVHGSIVKRLFSFIVTVLVCWLVGWV